MDVLTDIILENTQARPCYGVLLKPGEMTLPVKPESERTELEIGFGNGEYTVRYARAHTDITLFGIEASYACALRCARRAAGLTNLRILRADARYMMRELFADETLDKVTMNFPCPWPKRKQAHRRVTARDFADSLAAVLKVGGVFELMTDDEPYAIEAREKLGGHSALNFERIDVNPVRPITTKYERKWMDEGKSIYRLTFTKTCGFTVPRRAWGEFDMHIRTELPPSGDIIAALGGVSGSMGESHWVFGRYYLAPDDCAFLLEVLSVDEEFEQRFYIRLSERDGGGLVKLDPATNAFLTPAVRCALKDAAERLSRAS